MIQGLTKEYQEYFSNLEDALNKIRMVSAAARKSRLDPKPYPEIRIAEDLAGLVEGFIGIPKLAERIRVLSKKMSRERMAFKIAEEIVTGKFGQFDEEKAAALAIRAALAILTEGVTAAVYSEGIAKVIIKSNMDGSRYLALYFAGPIRSAGGTETALTPVVADFVRRLLGLDRYKPTEEEINRFIEELRLYEREVGRFQYHVSDEEVRKALRNLPVEITGIPSNKVEVSSYRNLPRIETNCLRGGALRVINDGIVGRAAKVLAVVEDLGIKGWEWLREIKEIVRKKKSGFMEDVPAGRPILSFPSRKGGFRLRYGRARNTGLAAVAVHPLTMKILQNFLAGGTQLKIETPGKSGVVLSVDSIEPPIVRLKDGSVVRVSYDNFDHIKDSIDKILFLGDLLVSFGDFLYNNKNLLPAGYVEEWWAEELQEAIDKKFNGDLKDAAVKGSVPPESLQRYVKDPFGNVPSVREAIKISQILDIPLHPAYTYFWAHIRPDEIRELRCWLSKSKIDRHDGKVTQIKGELTWNIKEILERICLPHRVVKGEIIIEGDDAHSFSFTLGIRNFEKKIDDELSTLENLTRISGLKIRDKASTFIGARVGRPEKASRREMSPPVHVLFPIGLNGGSQRDIIKACGNKSIRVDLVKRRCPKCQTTTFMQMCPVCRSETVLEFICPRCGRRLESPVCPVCKAEAVSYERQSIPLKSLVDEACRRLGFKPKQVKGVKGLTNKTRTPEIIEKGILRAKYALSVYKDGTIRFDMTNAPLTHFKPKEIGSSIEKLRELGYTRDYMGRPLVNSDQICELKIQDIVIPRKSIDYLIRTARFVDDLLQKVYHLPPFYKISRPEDLIGKIVIGLAPHTCAGVLGRIIGFTDLNVCFAHPFWHSAKRRDCDGDEDSIMMALDAFLNFSREYLPDRIGGIMDSPLFIIRAINPQEVQRQAHEIDVAFNYPLKFYEETLRGTNARDLMKIIDIVKHRFGSEKQFQGFGFTVPTSDINEANRESQYKKLRKMKDKLKAQLQLAEKIQAVDAKRVAEIVLTTHFLRDISGNLRAYTSQSFRCKRCNKRFRRAPLRGRCTECGGELTLTVYRGGIEKYLEEARNLIKKYDMPKYYAQRIYLIEEEIKSIFESGEETKQTSLSTFIKT